MSAPAHPGAAHPRPARSGAPPIAARIGAVIGAVIGALGLPGCGADLQTKPSEGSDTPVCVTDAEQWAEVAEPTLIAECAGCHQAGGPAGESRLLLRADGREGASAANLAQLRSWAAADPEALRRKPTGRRPHGGGLRFPVLDPRYEAIDELLLRLVAPGGCARPGGPPLRCGEGQPHPGSAPLRRLNEAQYQNTVYDAIGVMVPEGLYPQAASGPGVYRSFASANTPAAAALEGVQAAAERAARAAPIDAWLDCAGPDGAPAAPADCAAARVEALAEALYRRPPLPAERALLLDLLAGADDPAEGLSLALEVMLQAPQTLYIDHAPAPGARGAAPAALDDHALASRVAYALTDRPPDAALRAAAAAGALRSRAGVAAEARRLVASSAVLPVLVRFHEDWLHLSRLRGAHKDAGRYPTHGPALEQALRDEQALFVTEVVWMGEGDLHSLLLSEEGWVNGDLDVIFGTSTPGGAWAPTRHAPGARPGILSRPAFLAAHASAAAPSPVLRGAWLLEGLLCQELAPPPGVPMELGAGAAPTDPRGALAAHSADPACAGCHAAIDPLGFAFDGYGALGEPRAHDAAGRPVETAGALADPALRFDDPAALLAGLAAQPRARACYAQRWFEYAVGRPAEPEDACTLAALAARFEQSGGDLRGLLVDITLTDAFLYRHPLSEARP